MAQLRDAITSEFIYEGTPLQCVLIADEIGRDKVLFDDVGLAFDPDAVLQAHEENVAGLKSASTKTATPDDELRESVKSSYDAAIAEAQAAVEEAPKVEEKRAEAADRVG